MFNNDRQFKQAIDRYIEAEPPEDEPEYETNAKEVLNKLKTELTLKFWKHDKHFEDDKEARDIWEVTLTRGTKSFTFKFGQSIANEGIEPTAYDVLTCLQKYDVGTFEDFCSEFGYEEDSRKAEKIYIAVCKEYEGLKELFNEAELQELGEIQ